MRTTSRPRYVNGPHSGPYKGRILALMALRPARLAAVLLLWSAPLVAAGCIGVRTRPAGEHVTIGQERFVLEIAADEESRTHGLMGRAEIRPDGGMIFIFPDCRMRSFWMAECLVDIDLVFLDSGGRITAMHEMKVEPPRGPDESDVAYRARLRSYPSVYPAQFAIELRAGSIDRLGLEFEQRIELDLPRLKAMAR